MHVTPTAKVVQSAVKWLAHAVLVDTVCTRGGRPKIVYSYYLCCTEHL